MAVAADALAGDSSAAAVRPELHARSRRLLIIARSRMQVIHLIRPGRADIDFHQADGGIVRTAGTALTSAGPVSLSGRGSRSRRAGCLVIERSRDVADADDANQTVIVDHRQMADVVLVHEMTNMFERIGRGAGDQLLH